MRCRLAPVVFSELYKALSETENGAETLDERLGQIELDRDWLTEAAVVYEANWNGCKSDTNLTVLNEDHTLLAGWLLASLRRTEPSRHFSDDLLKRLRARASELPGGLTNPLPVGLNARVVSWTLGHVVGDVDRDVPFVPVRLPVDSHVAAAYAGLVDYCLQLKAVIKEPWPELVGTATFVRTLGLVEALRPDAGGPKEGKARPALAALIGEAKLVLPDFEYQRFRRHFMDNDFVSKRNTLSHVAPDLDKPTFVDLVDIARTWGDVEPTVAGITQFVCQQISEEMHGSREVDSGLWDRIRWDLDIYS